MKNTIRIVLFCLLFTGCKKADHVLDSQAPSIDLGHAKAFPKQCSVITKGDTVWLEAYLSDEGGLGSFSIDIHHNFDQHSHSTELLECVAEPVKEAVNPFVFIKTYAIEGAPKSHVAKVPLVIPETVDAGDYHFMIRVTDVQGWQTMRGISIKINN